MVLGKSRTFSKKATLFGTRSFPNAAGLFLCVDSEDEYQVFELVLAIKLVINCSSSLLPQEGQVATLFSCSFKVNANRHSFPHLRHLSYRGITDTPLSSRREI